MRKFIIVLFLSVLAVPVYGEMFCDNFVPENDEDTSGREWLHDGVSSFYFYCGYHSSNNGCSDLSEVYAKGSSGWGIYKCYENGPTWAYVDPNRWIADCPDDPETAHNRHTRRFCNSGAGWVYFADSNAWDALYNICKISQSTIDIYMDNCRSTGGILGHICGTKCECSERLGLKHKDIPHECECIDSDANLDEVNGTKVCVRGNFYACETDADCLGGRTPIKPSHSKAWRCVNQKYDVKVCEATACDYGWTPTHGYCQKNKSGTTPTTPTNDEDETTDDSPTALAKNNGGNGIVPQPIKNTCLDPNMDSDCKCKPLYTYVDKDGLCACNDNNAKLINGKCACGHIDGAYFDNGKCVCIDSNKVIKNGKCEYSAAYIAQLESDIKTYYDSLHSMMSGFKVSVWRDAEGKFNTARLASDSIAGVVLGTVGGIVTANVVKKSQIKQGFEDVKCSIGGQSVANFGDDFVVGR